MDRAAVITTVKLNAHTAGHPTLTDAEVETLVDASAIADPSGRAPSDEDWTPTYWVARAIQRALELRATRAAELTDTSTDGTTIAGSQLAAQLHAEARRWASRACGVVAL